MVGYQTIFVVDNDPTARTWTQEILCRDGLIVRAYSESEKFLAEHQEQQPAGCLVLDLHLPGMDGLELQNQMRHLHWTLPVLFLTGRGSIKAAVRAMMAGAMIFLEKPTEPVVLIRWVREAIERDAVRRSACHKMTRLHDRLKLLSNREQEILQYVLAGKTSREIADELYLSHKTVQLHRAHIMRKTGAGNVVELTQLASMAASGPALFAANDAERLHSNIDIKYSHSPIKMLVGDIR